MASGWTNRGAYTMIGYYFRAETIQTGFTLYLVNAAPAGTDNTHADITEASNYDGEQAIARNSIDFDTYTEDDGSNNAYVQIKDITFTASGGTCTTTHSYLLDNNGTEGSRLTIAYFDHGATQNIPDTSTLTLQDIQLTASTV